MVIFFRFARTGFFLVPPFSLALFPGVETSAGPPGVAWAPLFVRLLAVLCLYRFLGNQNGGRPCSTIVVHAFSRPDTSFWLDPAHAFFGWFRWGGGTPPFTFFSFIRAPFFIPLGRSSQVMALAPFRKLWEFCVASVFPFFFPH